MPKQDGNIKIVESFITSNKPMSLNNKNIYYNEYSDEVLIRYYQTLIAVRKDKSVRILEGINNYSASTNVLVRLIERIAKEKGCTVSYVKQFAKGSTIEGGNAYVVNYFKEDTSDIETIVVVANSEEEARDKAYDLVDGFDDVANIEEMSIGQAKSMGLLSKDKFAKGSTVKGVFSKYHNEYKFKIGDSVVVTHGSNKGIKGTINSMESDFKGITIKTNTGHILYGFNDADLDKYAKGSTVGGKKYQYYILQTKDGKVNWVVPKKIATIEEIVENAKKYNINIFASNFGTWESKRENGNRYTTEIVNEDGSDFKTDKEYNEISRAIGVVKKVKYAKGSTVKGKDLSGNYFSTNDFVGAHNLQKQAEKIFGKGWEAEDDVNQIESIINSLGGKYVVTVPEDRSQWNEMREQYDLANPTNDSNYDIFVISESDFKYGNGGAVGMYSIRVWESEDDRDMGESFIIEKVSNKDEAKEKAKKMYQKNDLAAVEVEDENGDTLLHLSSDGIEEYAKGGNMSIGFNYEIGGL